MVSRRGLIKALAAVGDAPTALPALPAIKAIVDDENDYVILAARYLVAVLEGNFRPSMPTGRPRAAGAPAGQG